MGDDDVFILESIAEAKKNDEENLRVTLILSLKDNLLSISRIIKIIEVIEFILLFLLFVVHLDLFLSRTITGISFSSKLENHWDLMALITTRNHR